MNLYTKEYKRGLEKHSKVNEVAKSPLNLRKEWNFCFTKQKSSVFQIANLHFIYQLQADLSVQFDDLFKKAWEDDTTIDYEEGGKSDFH